MASKLKTMLMRPLCPRLAHRVWQPVRGYPAEPIGSIASVVILVVFFYLGIRKLGSLPLDEGQLHFGLLLLFAVFMMGFGLSLLMQILWRLNQRLDASASK